MTSKKTTRRALFSSVIALILCCSMLVGTTFAWFTDEVQSMNNVITAGNLDIEAYVVESATDPGKELTSAGNLFQDVLWEPGHTQVVYLKVANEGTLTLKYQLQVTVENETPGINKAEEEFLLSEYLVFKVVEIDKSQVGSFDRETAKTAAGTEMGLKAFNGETKTLEPKNDNSDADEDYVALIVYMPETVKNEANHNGTKVPEITLGVHLFATQKDAEPDSFGSDYDKNAWNDAFQVHSASDLQAAINDGEAEIVLMGDIDADETIVIPEGATVALNLADNKLNGNVEIGKGANVTIVDGAINSDDQTVSGIQNNGGALTLEDVVINSARHGVRVEGGTATINGGTYEASGTGSMTQHALNVSDGANVTVNGGTFVGPRGSGSDSGAAVNVQAGSTVTINGGNFSKGLNNTLAAKGNLIVKGGTFDQDPSAYVAPGYTAVDNGNGTWTVKMNADTLKNLFDNVQDGGTVTLPQGTFTIPTTVAGKEITVEGVGEGTVIDFTQANAVSDASITFKNLHIQGKNENVMSGFGIQHTTGDIVYENCTFDGAVTGEYYGTVTYKNCTFTGTGYITTYAVKSATFENCVFDKADSRAVLVYSHGDNPCVVELTDCEFKAAAKGHTGAGDWTAAVEIDTTNIPTAGTSVTITNCTADGNYSGIVRDKSGAGKANAVITVDGDNWAFQAAQLASVLTADASEISVVLGKDIDCPITSLGTITGGSGEYKLGGDTTNAITIDLNGKKLNITTTYWSNIGAKNDAALFTIKNGSMTSSQASGTWNSYDLTFSNCNYVIENVVFDKAIAFANAGKSVKLNTVTVNESHDYYAIWICAEGMNVEIDGLTVNSAGRGIKIDEQYVGSPVKVTLKVSNATFKTAKKAAILVKSAAGADIALENVDISNVAADSTNAVWNDADSAAHIGKITVTGGSLAQES